MTVGSNNTVNQVESNIKVSKKQEIKETSNIYSTNDKKHSEIYESGLKRYNFLNIEGWFDNSVIEKDGNLKDNFILHLGKMTEKESTLTAIFLAKDFLSQLVKSESGEIVNGSSKKNPNVELKTINSITNYYQETINNVIESYNEFGGDSQHHKDILNTLSGILNFFRSYESKEQKNQYLSLGKANN